MGELKWIESVEVLIGICFIREMLAVRGEQKPLLLNTSSILSYSTKTSHRNLEKDRGRKRDDLLIYCLLICFNNLLNWWPLIEMKCTCPASIYVIRCLSPPIDKITFLLSLTQKHTHNTFESSNTDKNYCHSHETTRHVEQK